MLLQNTVDPWSNLHRDQRRIGSFIGNRGVIHDGDRQLKKRTWQVKRWLCCAKNFNNIDRRPLFKTSPFSYSELFFLDEATAYAAGHRPCSDCRREDFARFKKLWVDAACSADAGAPVGVTEIDSQLHVERLRTDGSKMTYRALLHSLPSGAMVALGSNAYLRRPHGTRLWTSSGYLPTALSMHTEVEVLTPKSVVRLIELGLSVLVHPSADA